jgi:hypothetical protein
MRTVAALPTIALALAMPAIARADAVQDQVVAAAKAVSPTGYGFTQTTRVERPGAAAKLFVSRYDPAKAVAQRWTLVSVDGKPPTAKAAAEAAKAARAQDVPSYAEVAKWFGAAATRIAQTPTSATYRFARLPAGTVKIGKHDASADTMAEATVDLAGGVPVVTRVRYVSTAGFRMALVVKVDRYVFVTTYRAGLAAQPVIDSVTAEMTGSLLGKAGTLTTRTHFTDLRAVR